MNNSKLIQLLHSFSAREWQRLEEYLHSPFHNKNEKIQKLFKYIRKQHEKGLDRISKKSAYKHLFAREDFDEFKINNIISDLNILTEHFLAIDEIVKDPEKINGLVLGRLKEKNAGRNFRQYLRKAYNRQRDHPRRDEDYYYRTFRIDEQADDFFIRNAKRTKDKTIESKVKHLDLFYFTVKLKESCEMLNRQNILSIEFENPFIDELADFIENNYSHYEQFPAIAIYYRVFKSLKEPEKEYHYNELIALLDEHHQLFSKEEARQIYDFAQNYCIKQINSGQSSFLGEILNLYKKLLEKELIYEGDFLSQWDYKNIVTVGIRLKEFLWTENFIRQYKERIAPEFMDNAYAYNLAQLYYGKGAYDSALPLLQDVEYTDVYYSLGARTTLIKIFYEEEAEEAFGNLTDTFNTYLHRNKLISDYQQASYKNMIRIAKKAFRLKMNRFYYSSLQYAKKYKRIREQIEAARHIANVNWLKDIVRDLEPEDQKMENT